MVSPPYYVPAPIVVGDTVGVPGSEHVRAVVNGVLGIQTPSDDASAGEEGYAAALRFYTERGTKIASVAADGDHNHVGVYTRDAPIGDEGSTNKRLSIQGGAPATDIDWLSSRMMKLSTSGVPETESIFVLEPTAGNEAYIKFKDGDMDAFSVISDGSELTVWDYSRDQVALNLNADGSVSVPNGGPADRGEIRFQNTRLYESADGSLVAEGPNGRTRLV